MPRNLRHRRRPGVCAVAALTFILTGASVLGAQRVLTTREWEEDLDFLVKTVATKHRSPFDRVSREDFEKAAADLKARLPKMKDHEAMVGLARLVALLRDGHSRLTLPVDPPDDTQSHTPTPEVRSGLVVRALPLRFYLFRNGLHVSATVPELREFLGAKVVKIGGLETQAAIEAVRPVVSYDSEMWVKHMAPEFLRLPEVLHAVGITRDPAAVPVEIEAAGGRRTLTLAPLPRGAQPKWVTWKSFPGGAAPLYLRHPERPFWFEFEPASRLLYVQVNEISNDKTETLAAFASRMRAFIDGHDVDKVVLDLRSNGGGNNYLNRGLVLALSGSDKVNRYGHLFTVIGRATFSAAISLVSALEQWTETIFVGEPTGNTPSQFGDSRKYQLPHSGLTVRLSSVYWRDWSVNEKRPWVAADIKAEPSWDEFAAGRDLALEAARAYAAPLTFLGRLEERYRWGGMESTFKLYYHYRSTPATAGVRTEEPLIGLAKYLETEGKDADARDVYVYCTQEYQDSFGALLGLGKNYVKAGDKKNAIETLKKALALKPADAEASEWLKRAEALGSGRQAVPGGNERAAMIPFSFVYDRRSSEEILPGWPSTESKERLDPARTRTTRTFTDPNTGLEVRSVVVEYDDFPAITDGTVYFRNRGKAETPLLEEVRALDLRLEKPAGGAFKIHHFRGSQAREDDFEPLETAIGPNERKRFAALGGRPTNGDMSYFNLELSGDRGIVIGIGWPGQWAAEFARGADGSLRLGCGQELVRLRLRPGEEIRTPLVALERWQGGGWLGAQNVWRRWMAAHNMPHPSGKPLSPQFGGCFGSPRPTAAQEIAEIDGYLKDGVRLDHWIIDAGWYPMKDAEWWNVGTWEVDASRFPKGLREVADRAHAAGIDFIVWFEPERVSRGSWLDRIHPDWVLRGDREGLLNLGNAEAFRWVTEHIDGLLVSQGIDHLRSDYNLNPLEYWRKNDAPGRQGMTENLYVQGFLAFWDELLRRHPAMFIDTCASGGRRLDLETLRRSVPLLRSDFPLGDFTIKSAIGQQCQTFGLSFWVPYHGTGAPNSDPYTLRSSYSPAYRIGYDALDPKRNSELFTKTVAEFRRILPDLLADFHPLTPYSRDKGDWIAWQYDSPENGRGVVQAFRREESPEPSRTLRLRGLDPRARYLVKDMDRGKPREASGRSLMTDGLDVAIAAAPGSALIVYEKKR